MSRRQNFRCMSITRTVRQQGFWICAQCLQRYSSVSVKKTHGSGKAQLFRGAAASLMVRDSRSHIGSGTNEEGSPVRHRVAHSPNQLELANNGGVASKDVQHPGLPIIEADQSSTPNRCRIIKIDSPAIRIRKFPTAAPENVYHARSRDHNQLSRLQGRPLGEAEDFQQTLDSVLKTFNNLQTLASPKHRAPYSSGPAPLSGSQSLHRRQSIRPENPSTSFQALGTCRRWVSTTRNMLSAQGEYVTAVAPASGANSPFDPPVLPREVSLSSTLSGGSIREHLRLWQEEHDKETKPTASLLPLSADNLDASQNTYTQSGEDDSFKIMSQDEEAEDGDEMVLEADTDDRTPSLLRSHRFSRRGDLVELVAGSEPLLAIFVRNLVDQLQFYTIRGEWVNRTKNTARFTVPGFVHPAELHDIIPYLPEEDIEETHIDKLHPLKANAPRNAGAGLIEKMSRFQQAADSVFRRNTDRMNRAYELIAPKTRQEGPCQRSLRDITRIVLPENDTAELTQAMLCAMHRTLIPLQNVVWVHSYDPRNPIYEIHSQQSMREIAQVRDWVRDFQEGITEDVTESFHVDSGSILAEQSQNPIYTLLKKARAAIERSRRSRPLSARGAVGPCSLDVEPVPATLRVYKNNIGESFNDKERIIIRYFDAWVASRYISPDSNLGSLGPMILRATGMYDGFPLARDIGFTFLQELGIVAPWENRTGYMFPGMRLPGHGLVSRRISNLKQEAHRWAERYLSDGAAKSKDRLEDSMAAWRKDWHDLPVFCIDSADAMERDDGISLEPVEGSQSEYWVHIHIANPSAFVPPSSPAARYAAQLSQSIYLSERKYPMLHPLLTQQRFSLANDRPCLTFSVRMSLDGDILEKAINSGIVRNVYYLTPLLVAQRLGLDLPKSLESKEIFSVGGKVPDTVESSRPELQDSLDDSHLAMLRRLMDLSQAAYHKRISTSGLDVGSMNFEASVQPRVFLSQASEMYFQIHDTGVRQFEGDPIISLETTADSHGPVAAMVSELMITAGRVASSWSMERNIPIPYRGIERNPEPRIQPQEFDRSVSKPFDPESLARYISLLGQTGSSASPLEHITLGLPAYCKATSPLRRYVDMYTHWQIEAALRYEKETGTSLIGSSNHSYLPFSWSEVEDCANTLMTREKLINRVSSTSQRHWLLQALFRAFHFHQAPLPETFLVRVSHNSGTWQRARMLILRTSVILVDNSVTVREGGYQERDMWETKIHYIDTYNLRIFVEPIRLVQRKTRMI